MAKHLATSDLALDPPEPVTFRLCVRIEDLRKEPEIVSGGNVCVFTGLRTHTGLCGTYEVRLIKKEKEPRRWP